MENRDERLKSSKRNTTNGSEKSLSPNQFPLHYWENTSKENAKVVRTDLVRMFTRRRTINSVTVIYISLGSRIKNSRYIYLRC